MRAILLVKLSHAESRPDVAINPLFVGAHVGKTSVAFEHVLGKWLKLEMDEFRDDLPVLVSDTDRGCGIHGEVERVVNYDGSGSTVRDRTKTTWVSLSDS